ncbi:folate-binding protein [Microbacterium sp. SYP-A9085]|uniref:CAF17-like 4Fe-4S cluster assembly/insertion protein YgfZ n=1 Tax=Microbacterium sp. SYP-A9085 TaxID=2664454 RepID=UPI00129AE31E|nr:folate-binding protein YgfZ [Microbacterium sp. SYP-A9085]MRH29414.1 folate-binding protein [Microbacterium sp. SYP-A9085]
MDAFARLLTAGGGAIVADGVLQHLGSPLAEQRELARGAAIAPLGDRTVLAVPGEDRLTWLESISTQRVSVLAPGDGAELLILDPNGHVEHAASVVDDGQTAWLIVDRADAEPLLAWLKRMRFRLRVDPRDASGELAVVGGTVAALGAVHAAAPNGVPLVWRDPWPGVTVGGWAYSTAEPHPGADRDWAEALVAPDEAERLARNAAAGGIRLAGSLAVEALRIAAWRPRMSDADERLLPHEVDWMRSAVHLDKGCYRGQETVAKVHNLGHPPRRLVALQLDGAEARAGDAVRAGDTVVGAVVAAAQHFEQGPIALALVRRNTPVGTDLVVDTAEGAVAAAQEVIVPPEAGATASVPRIPRLGRRR